VEKPIFAESKKWEGLVSTKEGTVGCKKKKVNTKPNNGSGGKWTSIPASKAESRKTKPGDRKRGWFVKPIC